MAVNPTSDATIRERVADIAIGSANVDGSHTTEGLAGVEVRTSGDVSSSFTAEVDAKASVKSASFADVMAATPVAGTNAKDNAAVKVSADASMKVNAQIRAEAAVDAVGRAVQTKNEGKVEKA